MSCIAPLPHAYHFSLLPFASSIPPIKFPFWHITLHGPACLGHSLNISNKNLLMWSQKLNVTTLPFIMSTSLTVWTVHLPIVQPIWFHTILLLVFLLYLMPYLAPFWLWLSITLALYLTPHILCTLFLFLLTLFSLSPGLFSVVVCSYSYLQFQSSWTVTCGSIAYFSCLKRPGIMSQMTVLLPTSSQYAWCELVQFSLLPSNFNASSVPLRPAHV